MKEYIVQAIAQETIDSFDAHNAPELIRCKDCTFPRKLPFPLPGGETVECNGRYHTPEWFCADGKKDGDGE